MKLELKNVKINNKLSFESMWYTASLYVDDIKVGTCKNEGVGGETEINIFKKYRNMIDDIKEYCRENPVKMKYRGKVVGNSSLHSKVDYMLFEHIFQKDLEKYQKDSLILREINTEDDYFVFHTTCKFCQPIKSLMKTLKGKLIIKSAITAMKKDGYDIMNTNIDYKELGL